ncbi:MAG: type II toxin-antitoxin system PemK/MazF family toxin [Campylobacterota bacterium]|nr:type II toxin-antitoxin system PemK/MazF family toxin [Campylobacterota bacterium]
MKKYDEWNVVKKEMANQDKRLIFKVREIFWLRIGQNVGYETDGKGDSFLRPVLVLRKFSKDTFLGIPLTTSHKDDMFHFRFQMTNSEKISYATLSQVKLFDTKRLHNKLGKISVSDFEALKVELKDLIFE